MNSKSTARRSSRRLQGLAVLFALGVSALTFTGGASAALRIGVSDDLGRYPDQSAWFLDSVGELGMTENRISVNFDPAAPTTIPDQWQLDLYVPLATLRGVRPVFSVSPTKAKAVAENPNAPQLYAQYVALLARTYPTVDDFIIGNEPNQPRFWQPQFGSSGQNVSARSYYKLLAASYDALKAVDPTIRVIGLGLSPRGGDRPGAPNNVSTSPVRFINALGKAYRASGRKRPIMDELAYHPYPDHDRDPLMKGYRWPNAGVPNLGRIKQAFWDAFRGTAQPRFPEGTGSGGMKFRLDELGWQANAAPSAAFAYFGRESIRPTNEIAQAKIYGDAVRYLACDASVHSVLFFLLRDEPNLDRWQAGLVRADGTRRPSFYSVKACTDTRRLSEQDAPLAPHDPRRGRPGEVAAQADPAGPESRPRARAERPRGRSLRGRPLQRAWEASAQAGRQRGRLPLTRRAFQHALPPRSLHLARPARGGDEPRSQEQVLLAAPLHRPSAKTRSN